MINNNIKNWLALTKDNKYITIDKVTNNKEDYLCPCCNEVLRARALESELIQPHFYHLQNDNLNSCNYETAYKRYWKDNLISLGEIIELPFLGQITCLELKHNYKLNDITADIYIKTDKGQEILFLFSEVENKFNDLNYNIFYIDFMSLKLNRSNLLQCIKLLHSAEISKLNNKLKQKLLLIQKDIENKIKKESVRIDINIDKYKLLHSELLKANYYKESELMDDIILSLEIRQKEIYKYRGQIIEVAEVENLNKLVNKIIYATKYNIDTDINILKRIDYNIYKGSSWNRYIYFDFIKNISKLLKEHIKQLEELNI